MKVFHLVKVLPPPALPPESELTLLLERYCESPDPAIRGIFQAYVSQVINPDQFTRIMVLVEENEIKDKLNELKHLARVLRRIVDRFDEYGDGEIINNFSFVDKSGQRLDRAIDLAGSDIIGELFPSEAELALPFFLHKIRISLEHITKATSLLEAKENMGTTYNLISRLEFLLREMYMQVKESLILDIENGQWYRLSGEEGKERAYLNNSEKDAIYSSSNYYEFMKRNEGRIRDLKQRIKDFVNSNHWSIPSNVNNW